VAAPTCKAGTRSRAAAWPVRRLQDQDGAAARGGNFEFANEIFVAPFQELHSRVEKGIVEAAQRGFLAGFPVVDFKVILYDGSYHDVDSNELSFKTAGRIVRKAMEQAKPTLLEPVMTVEITIPDEFAGTSWATSTAGAGAFRAWTTRAARPS